MIGASFLYNSSFRLNLRTLNIKITNRSLMTRLFFTLTFLLGICIVHAQNTFVYFHNNTELDFTVTTSGNPPPDPADWEGYNGNIVGLQPHLQLMRLYRDWATSDSPSGTYYVTSYLDFPTGETVEIKFEYDVEEYDFFDNPFPSITFKHTASGPGFSHPWRDDRTIYDQPFTVNGENYFLRYQSYSTVPDGGTYDDVLFSIYKDDDTPYAVDPADATNPNIINVMSYNVFMRPTTLFPGDDQATRADHIADYVPGMDAIILQEVFDNTTRQTLLDNLAAEYPYQSQVVDEPSNALEDGGVVIVSKWPIEVEGQYLWGDVCFEDDCLSNKGVKYVKIDKLGKKYHLFGTHMDAFNEVDDINTRKQQLVDWKNYIDAQNIPNDEAILMGGDYNVDKFANKLGEYDSLFGDFAAELPIYTGFYSTWDPTFNLYNMGEPYDPEFLDFVFSQGEHLQASYKENNSLIMRSNHIDMWRIFDLSDHYAIWGRFEFPEPTPAGPIPIKYTSLDNPLHPSWNLPSGKPKGVTIGLKENASESFAFTPSHVIYPNPSNGNNIRLDYTTDIVGSISGTIQNISGQVIHSMDIEVAAGKNTIQLPSESWPSGMYILKMKDNQGNYQFQEKIVIEK